MKIIGLFILLTLISCNSRKKELRQLVDEWTNKEILFPEGMETRVSGRDTACPELFASPYKILNYIDTSGCTECRLKLQEWEMLRQEAESLHLPVTFIFVAWVKNYDELETIQHMLHSNLPFLYDREGKLQQLNHFPDNPAFQTFLLDSDNRVQAIGNPLENDRLWELYRQIITRP